MALVSNALGHRRPWSGGKRYYDTAWTELGGVCAR